jgi:hypothetical protein
MLGALTDLALKAGFGRRRPPLPWRCASRRPAAFDVRHRARPCRSGRDAARHRRRDWPSAARRIGTMKPATACRSRRLRLRFEGIAAGYRGPNYSEEQGIFRCATRPAAARRRSSRPSASIRRARCRRPRPASARFGLQPALRLAGRRQTTDGGIVVRIWWKPMVTLIWLGGAGDDGWGRLSRCRPAPAGRRPSASQAPGRLRQRRSAGVMRVSALRRCRRLLASLLFVAGLGGACPTRCWPIRRWRRGPGRSRPNCAAWSARTSRSTIPNAAGARPARARARAAEGRRHDETGDRLCRRPLRRIRAAEAALQLRNALLWGAPLRRRHRRRDRPWRRHHRHGIPCSPKP